MDYIWLLTMMHMQAFDSWMGLAQPFMPIAIV